MHVCTLLRLTHNIHVIPLLHKDETYNLIIISCEFKTLELDLLIPFGLNLGAKQARNTSGVTLSSH
jgi:hypothetical protein